MDADALQFHAALSQAATRTEAALAGFLPGEETTLGAAMRYAVLSGGKRLRAFLALEGAAIFRVPAAQAAGRAASILPPQASAAATTRMGRMRLPPAKRLYLMAL